MLHDPLAATLSNVMNAERVGKREVMVKPASLIIKTILRIMNEHNYIGSFEENTDERGGSLKINLLGNINNCGVIKPRFSTKWNEFEKWEKRHLPAKDFGILIVSTSRGIMTHTEAKKNTLGGRLLAYCY